MRKLMLAFGPLIFLSVLLQAAYGQSGEQDPVVRRLFLVGDAGTLSNGRQPVCDWLRQHVDWNDSVNMLIYLGDNIYPGGMPPEGGVNREEATRILDYEVSVVAGKKAKAWFVPGNHDWRR